MRKGQNYQTHNGFNSNLHFMTIRNHLETLVQTLNLAARIRIKNVNIIFKLIKKFGSPAELGWRKIVATNRCWSSEHHADLRTWKMLQTIKERPKILIADGILRLELWFGKGDWGYQEFLYLQSTCYSYSLY